MRGEGIFSSQQESSVHYHQDGGAFSSVVNYKQHQGSIERVLQLVSKGYYQWTSNKSYSSSYHKKRSEQEESDTIVLEEPVSAKAKITDLPVAVLLEIFSYLDVVTLCRVPATCQSWYNISNDDLLWERKLNRDANKWEMIDHSSHPDSHIELNPELSHKEVYLRCCPECRLKREYEQPKSLIPNLGFYFGFSVPRVVMFGSGLDSNGFVKSLLWDDKSPFTVKKMFPGKFEGLGSGFTLQYPGGTLDLITLYRMSKAERQNDGPDQNGRVSKLLIPDAENEGEVTLSHPARELCSTINAFIYVVKAHDINKGESFIITKFFVNLQRKVKILL